MRCTRGAVSLQAGIALVAVMWMVGGLSILAAGLAFSSRVELMAVQQQQEQARVRALADGAIRLATMSLLGDGPERNLYREVPLSFDGVSMRVRITPATGLVDLNLADERVLTQLFVMAGGLDVESAATLAQRVMDWRDPDTAPLLPFGAEDEAYQAAGRPEGARDGRFETPEDLRLVLGVDGHLYDKLRHLIGIEGSRAVDPLAASPDVLMALGGGDAALLAAVEAGRQAAPPHIDPTLLPAEMFASSAAFVFRIEVWVEGASGARWRRAQWVEPGARPGAGLPWTTLLLEPLERIS